MSEHAPLPPDWHVHAKEGDHRYIDQAVAEIARLNAIVGARTSADPPRVLAELREYLCDFDEVTAQEDAETYSDDGTHLMFRCLNALEGHEFVLRVLKLGHRVQDFVGSFCDQIMWRTDGEYAPVTFLVSCNDLFDWACADNERLTPENIEIAEKALDDMKAVDGDHGLELFCARVRKRRPQRPVYKSFNAGEVALFDACGPERKN